MSEDFFEALYGDDSVKLRRLIAQGVDVNRRDRGGTAPIYLVAGNAEKARLLLDAGADPNVQSPEGTALGFAASWGMDEAVEVLLACGADPNLVDGRMVSRRRRSCGRLKRATWGSRARCWSTARTQTSLLPR